MTEGYNGWKNWATFQVALWVDSDRGDYHHVRGNRPYTAEKAREMAYELFPSGTPDMKGAWELCPVDWAAIAEAWNED